MPPRVVVITGGSSGIGRATAIRFAQDGWRVGLIARGEEGLAAAVRDVVEAGGTAAPAIADVADAGALEAAAASIEALLGPIDVWINNAAVGAWGWFEDIPAADFDRLIQVNLIGTVNGTRVAMRRMLPRNQGTIVQILSAISHRGIPLQSAYSASKHGLRGFTEAVRAELMAKRSRVHLIMVHPPAVNTPFYDNAASHVGQAVRPPPPVYQPELVADAIYAAARSRRRATLVGEQSVALAFGNAIAPGLIDQLAGRFGVAPQLRDGPANATPNLDRPSRLHAVRGQYDRESLSWSPQAWLSKSRDAVGLGLGVALLLALAAASGRKA